MSTLNKIKENIAKAINKALKQEAVTPADLIYPPKPEFGDLSLACYKIAKTFNKSAVELAEYLVRAYDNAPALKDFVSGTKAVGPYFNFTLNKIRLAQSVLKEILKGQDKYGLNFGGKNKKIMVEFAHPNTHKAFHIGHLRNILTGEAMARIMEANGHKVIRANYQGDIGLHIAKCLWGIENLKKEYEEAKNKGIKAKAEFLGKAYAFSSKNYDADEQAKKEITDINKKIYNADKSIKAAYKTTRKWSLDYFNNIYKRVNTKFDRLYFESEVFKSGREIVLKNLKKGVFKLSDGAVIFPGENYGLHTRVFINSLGNPTYEAKDMGLAELQFKEYKPEKIIHLVGPEQVEYFKVIIKAIEVIMPKLKSREIHLSYGWVDLKGGKMSSRLGNVVLGEWLLDEAKKEILKIMKGKRSLKNKEQVAEKVSLAAVKYSILKNGINSNISFSLEESISFSGMSGPYLQYTYARIKSIIRKANLQSSCLPCLPAGRPDRQAIFNFQLNSKSKIKNSKQVLNSKSQKINYGSLVEPKESLLINKLARYQEIVEVAGKNYDPSEIAKYLFELAQEFNDYYHSVPVLKAEAEVKMARLALIMAVAQVIKNGLELLGIEAVEEM